VQKCAHDKKLPERHEIKDVLFEMAAVAGGTFSMGAAAGYTEACDWEKPARDVTLSDCYIGRGEATQALWVAATGSNPSCFTGYRLPVETVRNRP
jgi:formylglycine-generating enzyme required for sulfatase activity